MNRGSAVILAIAILGAIVTQVVVEILRHRSFLKHRDSGDIPSTQEVVFKGLLISGFLVTLAVGILAISLVARNH